MEMDPKEAASILKIRKGSPAANAELRAGDQIKQMNGQPILSSADIQWVLHHSKNPDTLSLVIERKGKAQKVELRLAKGWRTHLRNWSYLHNIMVGDLTNILLFEAEPELRQRLKLKKDALGLRVQRPKYWRNGNESPFEKGDVIVEVDGKRNAMTVSAFAAYVYRKESPRVLQVTVVRGEAEKKLKVTIP